MFSDSGEPREVQIARFFDENELKISNPESSESVRKQREIALSMRREWVNRSDPEQPIPEETREAFSRYEKMLMRDIEKIRMYALVKMAISMAKFFYDSGDNEGFEYQIGGAIRLAEETFDIMGGEEMKKILDMCKSLGFERTNEY
jgi:hypothetical protein